MFGHFTSKAINIECNINFLPTFWTFDPVKFQRQIGVLVQQDSNKTVNVISSFPLSKLGYQKPRTKKNSTVVR